MSAKKTFYNTWQNSKGKKRNVQGFVKKGHKIVVTTGKNKYGKTFIESVDRCVVRPGNHLSAIKKCFGLKLLNYTIKNNKKTGGKIYLFKRKKKMLKVLISKPYKTDYGMKMSLSKYKIRNFK